MKRLIALFLSVIMFLLAFSACAENTDVSTDADSSSGTEVSGTESENEKTLIRIAGMKGPTSIGLVGLLEDNEKGTTSNEYNFTLAGTADEITPLLNQGKLDIAAVPANLASVLYNKTKGEIKLLAINTLGVLYIVSKGEEIDSLEDLKGKTIYATGKGTTPEYTLRHILSENGIDPDKDVTLDFKSEATEVVSVIEQAENAVAMLPQPYVTIAQGKIEGLKVVIDLNEEWEKKNENGGIVTGVFVVRKSFAEENPEAVKTFLNEYQASASGVNDNVSESAQLVEKFGIFAANVAEKAIPQCNITYIAGEAMKQPINNYLGVLYAQKPESIGGKLPAEDFFYIAD